MSFLDSLLSLFGKKPAKPQNANYMGDGNNTASRRKLAKQVYEGTGRVKANPEWAEGLNNTMLAEEMKKHIQCRYTPNFAWKKIMSTTTGPDGNLLPEYEGIAGDCGAVKNFGMKVARRDGYMMPYKYVDVQHAFKACCDNPKRCPFYLNAVGEATEMTAKMQRR
jgi:hypothetical protein